MITKIDISNFGLYKDYRWDQSIGRTETFRRLNIIYGRNYSGKTTLSRIFKCIEDQCLHKNYGSGSFTISLADSTQLTPHTFNTDFIFRVYNSDFVRENLSWLHNEDGSIKPFTILGAKNVELEKKLEEVRQKLGNADESQGLLFSLSEEERQLEQARSRHYKKYSVLEEKLRSRANDKIKVTPHLFIPTKSKKTYSISDIKNEIEGIKSNLSKFLLTEADSESLKSTLGDTPLINIDLLKEVKPNFSQYHESVEAILTKSIKPSVAIMDLLEDSLLQEWVRQGINKHKGKRDTCAFCGGSISPSLWEKLDEHFSKESEDLRAEVDRTITVLESAKTKLEGFLSLTRDQFYSSLQADFDNLYQRWNTVMGGYRQSLDELIVALNGRREDIFAVVQLAPIEDYSEDILQTIKEFNVLIRLNNEKSTSLESDQEKARAKLRKADIAQYLIDIGYDHLKAEIKEEEDNVKHIETYITLLSSEVQALLAEKDRLENQVKNESRGAELVNEHLSHYFGHSSLRLVAIDEEEGVLFKVQRDGIDAYNLSEGECSLISFCYFVAKIQDELYDNMKCDKLIIYIDDPMSSLDSNHIFFMYSLIESVIAKPERYAQLFISTHNLDFLKYLRKLTIPKDGTGKNKKSDIKHLLVERKSKESTILRLAPPYIRKYVTEFNYLFEQIYICSGATEETISHDYQYNFGNNMRKFLEAYLFYKYPSHVLSNDQRIKKYFDNDTLTVALINRITNEYSHLEDNFDRSLAPLDVAEIRQISGLVLDRIKSTDPDQFEALLESVGAPSSINGRE